MPRLEPATAGLACAPLGASVLLAFIGLVAWTAAPAASSAPFRLHPALDPTSGAFDPGQLALVTLLAAVGAYAVGRLTAAILSALPSRRAGADRR